MTIRVLAVGVLLAVATQAPAKRAYGQGIPVQLGVRVSPDTVTVGERFIVVVRVRAPRGATIEFPEESDSAATTSPTATQMIGKPAVQSFPDSANVTVSAAYRLAAWDVGPQPLGIGSIQVRLGADTGYVSIADRSVHVRSVLPADSTLHVPKPPRPAIELLAFDWMPLLIAALVLAAAALAWRLWIWYRRRRARPLDPFNAAEREFARIESMGLVAAGKPELHAALMSDVMREYLSARVPGIERSQTSSELLATSGEIRAPAQGLGELLWRADLIKFARHPVPGDEAEKLGASARGIVRAVEEFLVAKDRAEREKKAA